MGIQRASALYPDNGTTVDSGGGVDIRFLNSSNGGTNDASQDCEATHTQDDVTRTFDPATAGVRANNDPASLQKLGWALRLVDDMTPTDDTNCDAYLPGGDLTINLDVTIDQSGGTYAAGSYGPTWIVSLWEYDPSDDTGTLIASGSDSSTTWSYTPAVGDIGTFKVIGVSVTTANHEFTEGTILLLQIGLDTGTVPNPTLGAATWTYTLRVDDSNTNITWDTGQGIRQACALSSTLTGVGTASKGSQQVGITRLASGIGTASFTKAVTAAKSFTLTGVGTASHTKAVTFSNFQLVGTGTVDGTITLPIDEVPEGGGDTVTPVFGVFD